MFGLYRKWKRSRLSAMAMPPEWEKVLERQVRFYRRYNAKQREKFLENLKIFIGEKRFIGAADFEITDEVKVVIAAIATRLIQRLGVERYDRVHEIVVYPFDYRHPKADPEFDSDLDEGSPMLGEVHPWNVVVLSWPSVLEGLKEGNGGSNTVVHEFAHVLDHLDGAFDGTPRLRDSKHYASWVRVLSKHYKRLERGDRPEADVLDEYGASNEAEFFAVATEAFVDRPEEFKQELPELYHELKRFFGFDPDPKAKEDDYG